jgi:hypothetical protein
MKVIFTVVETLQTSDTLSISLQGNIHGQLQHLSPLEKKKKIQKISIFMTIVILPGGQYVEKGLILNLPNDIESVNQHVCFTQIISWQNIKASCSIIYISEINHLISK